MALIFLRKVMDKKELLLPKEQHHMEVQNAFLDNIQKLDSVPDYVI